VSANRLLLLAAIPLFLVLLVVAVLSMRFAAEERSGQGWVVHTYQVMNQARQILADAQDSETGQRGYIITRNPAYLQPFRNGTGRLRRDLDTLKSLTADNPDQQKRLPQLENFANRRVSALLKALQLAPSYAPPPPAMLRAMADGKRQMDGLRATVAQIMADEDKLLALRTAQRRAAEVNEIRFALSAALIAFVILLGAALVLVRANVRLLESERDRSLRIATLQAMLDNVRDGIVVFDGSGRLSAFNATFFQFLGFPRELAAIGTPLSAFQAFDRDRGHAIFNDLPMASGEATDTYTHLLVSGRDLDVYRASVPGSGFLVAAMDVTSRMRAEALTRQTQKMEAIGQLTGGIAHDFNNLLQVIGTNLDLLAGDVRGDARATGRMQNAISAVERGARLTNQLLAFARKQALEPRSTNLGRLVQTMTDLLRRTLGERIEVEAMVAGGLWNTLVDPTQVENIILNLAINARDAMPDGGKLTIEVANAFLDDSYAAAHAEVIPGQYVLLAVSDTGTGMTPDVAARAFDPFFTTKPEGRGTGLGLSQVWGFTKQSGGHVKIYTEVGHGTTVKIYLPRTKKPQEISEPVATSTPVEGGSETILVVEDDAGVRASAVDMLTELGYSVLRAENAEQALVVLSSGAPIDLLFTDVVMPGPVSTRELARRAQALHPNIAVLYTSGYTQNAIVHDGKLDEGVVLISKPYRKDDLARKLRTLLPAGRKTAPAPEPAPTAKAASNDSGAPRYKKVLVVDDIVLVRMTTVDMVEQMGYATAEAGTGAEALALIKSDPDIDALVTDLGLPGMNGRELIAEARKIRPALKVVVASGYSTDSGEGPLKDVASLMKPFDMSQLQSALEGA
jgi:signal transduction histidine kinase/CheY-like chemotaxis protein